MSDSLPLLEAERSQILRQISALGDLRPGSISAVVRRCGKPSCHCAKPNDPGHDAQLRLTRKVDGKTVAESFASPAALQKCSATIRSPGRVASPLASGYKSHRFNWLEIADDFSWDSISRRACKTGTCSNSVTLSTCRIS